MHLRQTLQLLDVGMQGDARTGDALSACRSAMHRVMLSQDVELLDDEPDNVIRTRHGRPSKKAGKREGAGSAPGRFHCVHDLCKALAGTVASSGGHSSGTGIRLCAEAEVLLLLCSVFTKLGM
jgi:hypothetical protein